MTRTRKDQVALLQVYVDEAIKRHSEIEDLRKGLADFYENAVTDLNRDTDAKIKSATLKKLVKQFISPEEPEDPALAQLMAMVSPPSEQTE